MIRNIVEYQDYYELPLKGVRITNTLFYQPSGENKIVLKLQHEDYRAGFHLESFDLYHIDGTIINSIDEYMSTNPLEDEVCVDAKVYKTGHLEIRLSKHIIRVKPDLEYESWSFGETSEGAKIICLANGELMTFGAERFVRFE